MSHSPVVSVVMPFLNGERFLAESVESVRAQTYQHWELLLCDDGSTDRSRQIAEEFAAADPARIRVLAHPDRGTHGASAARNLGLAVARGRYVAFLDGDDVWLPHKLSEQVAVLDATPEAEVLVGSTEFWYGWTGEPADASRDRVLPVGVPHGTLLRPPILLRRMIMGSVAVPATCSLIGSRDAMLRCGGFEPSFRRVFTDQAFYVKLFLRSPVLVVSTCWDRYRRHAGSSWTSAERSGEFSEHERRFLAWVRGYLSDQGSVPAARDPRLRLAVWWAGWRLRNPRAARAVRSSRHAYYRLAAAARRRIGA